MLKVLFPCKIKDQENGSSHRVFIELSYTEKGKLSLMGVIGPYSNGNAHGSCGQIQEALKDAISKGLVSEYASNWDEKKLKKLLAVWELYHLNDMSAGCSHQKALGWKNYDEHPSEPCPICGYAYGTAWLFEEVPAEILAWLEELEETATPYPWKTYNIGKR